jgi:hypothetical protein
VGGLTLQTHHKALILVPLTILTWLAVTFLTAPEPREKLESFYRRVRPGGAWGAVARACPEVASDGFGLRILLTWLAGVVMVYGILFGSGKLLLGEPQQGLLLLAAAAVGAVPVVRELRR